MSESHRTADTCDLYVGDTVEHLPSGLTGTVVAIGTTASGDIYQVAGILTSDLSASYRRDVLKLVERARDDDAPTGEHVDAAVIVAAIDRAREAIVAAVEKRDTIVNVAAVDAEFDDDLATRDAVSAIRARLDRIGAGATRSELRTAILDVQDIIHGARL